MSYGHRIPQLGRKWIFFARASEETSKTVVSVDLGVEMEGRPLTDSPRTALPCSRRTLPALPRLAPPRSTLIHPAWPGPASPRRALPRRAPPMGYPGFGFDK